MRTGASLLRVDHMDRAGMTANYQALWAWIISDEPSTIERVLNTLEIPYRKDNKAVQNGRS